MSAVAFQLIGTVIGAVAKVRSSQAEQVQYEMKARNEEIKGRTDAVNYKNQGTAALRNMERAMAASTARSAAGGLNPFASGESADLINTYSLNIGVGDFGMARTNAMLALDASKRNANQFRTAGKYAVQYGMMSAAADTFTGISSAFENKNPFGGLFSTTPSTLPNANARSGPQ